MSEPPLYFSDAFHVYRGPRGNVRVDDRQHHHMLTIPKGPNADGFIAKLAKFRADYFDQPHAADTFLRDVIGR